MKITFSTYYILFGFDLVKMGLFRFAHLCGSTSPLLVMVFLITSHIETNGQKESLFDHLSRHEDVSVTLTYAVDSLLELRMKPVVFQGIFEAKQGDSALIKIPVKVSARGKFRRKKCDFPPIKLDFPKGKLKDLSFTKADDYKLVTHCLNNRVGLRILNKELMVYQMFGLASEDHFRTKYFDITYVDPNGPDTLHTYAFMIESNEELADRYEGEWCDCMGSGVEDLDPARMEEVAFFLFLVGNRDMDIKTGHNIKLLMRDGKKLYPFPYDFDFSIFVKAPYAYVSTLNYQPRLYLGYLENREYLPDLIDHFQRLKRPYYELIRKNRFLTKTDRRWCRNYLKSLYSRMGKKTFKIPYRAPANF